MERLQKFQNQADHGTYAKNPTTSLIGAYLLVIALAICLLPADLRLCQANTHIETPFRWESAIIYFVLIDRFADGDSTNNKDVNLAEAAGFHGGDIKGVTQHLKEIAELGANVIWINPVVKNIDGYVENVGFRQWPYHGYWADDLQQMDQRFGSERDLKNLVDQAHAAGIKVLLDVVYNHVGHNSRYLTRPEAETWLRIGKIGNPCGSDDVTQCLAGLPDFKTENPAVADYLMSAHIGLAKRVGVDGFRLDSVKHVAHEFWRTHRQRVKMALGNEFFLLGEVRGEHWPTLKPRFDADELDAAFDHTFKESAQAWVEGRGRTGTFSRYFAKRQNIIPGYHLAHSLSSHHQPGLLDELNGDKDLFRLCVALQFASSGIPVIYYGEEVGREGGTWPHNQSDMPWGDREILPGKGLARDENLRAFYRQLIQIRQAHPALWRGVYQELYVADDLWVFSRADAQTKNTVIVAVNRGDAPLLATVPLPADWRGDWVKEILYNSPAAASNTTLQINIPPKKAHIYTLYKH